MLSLNACSSRSCSYSLATCPLVRVVSVFNPDTSWLFFGDQDSRWESCLVYLVPTRVSHFNRYLSRYRCVASSLHRSDVRLPYQPLAIRLQVRYRLSTSFRRASPISTATYPPTVELPALYLSDTRLQFQPLAIRLPVRCPLSTWFRCASPFSTATHLPTCSPLVSICPT